MRKRKAKQTGAGDRLQVILQDALRRFPPKGRLAKAVFTLRKHGEELTRTKVELELRDDLNSSSVRSTILEILWGKIEPLLLQSYLKEVEKQVKRNKMRRDPDTKTSEFEDVGVENDEWRDLGECASG